MDAIDDATLERMLDLAAVAVPVDARKALRRDLGRVLASMDAIAEAPIGELPPTYGVAHGSRTRPDTPVAGLDREAALAAAPKSTDGHFVLPSAMSRSKR